MNAQLHVENSVFPKSSRGGPSRTTGKKSKETEECGDTQAFSNFIMQEINIEGPQDNTSSAVTMSSRTQYLGDKESLFCKNGCSTQSTSVQSV